MKKIINGMVVASIDKEHKVKINAFQEVIVWNSHTQNELRFSDVASAFNTAVAILELCVRVTMTKTKIVIGPKRMTADWAPFEAAIHTDDKPEREGEEIAEREVKNAIKVKKAK